VTSLIFSTPSYDYLARDLARGGGFDCGEVQRDLFPDGEHYLRLCTPVSDRHVVVVGGTISDAATLEIYDLACAVVENGCATLTLVVPWYGYATQDRAVKSGEAVTAKTRARLLSSIPPAKLANEILLLDLHSEGIPHYFEGTIHPRHVYGKPVMEELARELGGQEFVVGSTDAGRAKWVESYARDLFVPAAFVYKRRRGPESTEVTAVSMKFGGETVVIYDDMIRTGTSLLNAARAYRDAGAGRIIALATHGVFANGAYGRLVDSGLFSAIACTDSHPNALALRERGLIVRSCSPLFLPHLSDRSSR
jgi:ribose-phosphate pyrophosphokinase